MKRENRRLAGVAHGYSVTVKGGVLAEYLICYHDIKTRKK